MNIYIIEGTFTTKLTQTEETPMKRKRSKNVRQTTKLNFKIVPL